MTQLKGREAPPRLDLTWDYTTVATSLDAESIFLMHLGNATNRSIFIFILWTERKVVV